MLCASWHRSAPLPAAAEAISSELLLLVSGHLSVSAQALASHLLHRADATRTELSMGGLNLGFLIEAFGRTAGTVMPKNRQPPREVQQSNSLLSEAMPAASRTTWSQAEPWGQVQTAKKRVV